MGVDSSHGSTNLLLILSVVVAVTNSQRLIGSIATCENDGEQVFVPRISTDPCIDCVCRRTRIECRRQTCQPLEGCHVIQHVKPRYSCCDICKGCSYHGRLYPSGTDWTSDHNPCVAYRCQAAVLTKTTTQCVITCKNPTILPNQCCPVCPGCTAGGLKVNEGQTVSLPKDKCTSCQCQDGFLQCERRGCPVLNCPPGSQVLPAGECCAVCKDLRRVFDLPHGKCLFQRRVYDSGATILNAEDACTHCSCRNGTVECRRRVCRQLDCAVSSSQSPLDRMTCCPRCVKYKRRCQFDNSQYNHGDTWKHGVCTHCYCYDGTTRCHVEKCGGINSLSNTVECPKNHQYKVVEGKCCPECVEMNGVCAVFGDPHYRTFDGRTFTFQGACSYLLVASSSSWCGPLTASRAGITTGERLGGGVGSGTAAGGTFVVKVTNVVRGSSSKFTWTKSVRVTLDGAGGKEEEISVDLYQKLRVSVNRTQVELPFVDQVSSRFSIVKKSLDNSPGSGVSTVVMKTTAGLQVVWDGGSYLEVSVPPTFKGQVCGLCGNYNSDGTDDLIGPDGRSYFDVSDFGSSWRIGHRDKDVDDSCTQHHRKTPPRPVAAAVTDRREEGLRTNRIQQQTAAECKGRHLRRVARRCSVLRGALFTRCHRTVDVESYYQSCVTDSCNCPADTDCACLVFAVYHRVCSLNGVDLDVTMVTTPSPVIDFTGSSFPDGVVGHRSNLTHILHCEHPAAAAAATRNRSRTRLSNQLLPQFIGPRRKQFAKNSRN